MSTVFPNPYNHDLPPADTPQVRVNYNGRWIEVPRGLNVVEVARRQGDFLPHYCYHPKLSISGNCRMCLFEMGMPRMGADRQPVRDAAGNPELNWIPRPQIGCATNVTEGMGIRTDSPMVADCRKGVMEFLLINHPLDCPICDQAGECKLQEFSSEFGSAVSRFVEQKVRKPKNVDLGARIVLDDERCILCSRCVRFAREVLEDDVLGIVERGSHSTLTAHPGRRFDHGYSLNSVDICPVGALTSKDFRFKMRVWFLRETKSLCTSCARGCNVTIGARQDRVYRLTPRVNEEVNSHWMCDHGRLNLGDLDDERRLSAPWVRRGGRQEQTVWTEAVREAAGCLKAAGPDRVAVLASARMTNEELFLAGQIAAAVGATLTDVVPRAWEADRWLKVADANPNSAGARLMGLSRDGRAHRDIVQSVRDGSVTCLLALHENPSDAGLAPEDLGKLAGYVAMAMLPHAGLEAAHVLFPAAGFSEKRGTMINHAGRLQRLNQAVPPPGGFTDLEILHMLLREINGGKGACSVDSVFAGMAAAHAPLAGLTPARVGDSGVSLELPSEILNPA